MFIAIEGITSANINNSKYMCIIEDDDEIVPVVNVFAALWILSPNINDDVPIRKETIVRIFWVIPGTITIGSPWVVCGDCCCCAAAGSIVKINEDKNNNDNNKIMLQIKMAIQLWHLVNDCQICCYDYLVH